MKIYIYIWLCISLSTLLPAGGIVLPLLGAVPDSAIIIVSGLGDDAQTKLSVGMGWVVKQDWFLMIIVNLKIVSFLNIPIVFAHCSLLPWLQLLVVFCLCVSWVFAWALYIFLKQECCQACWSLWLLASHLNNPCVTGAVKVGLLTLVKLLWLPLHVSLLTLLTVTCVVIAGLKIIFQQCLVCCALDQSKQPSN